MPKMQKVGRVVKGYTLIECLVATCIVGLLTSAAVPYFKDVVKKKDVNSLANALHADLSHARESAILRSSSITVCASKDGKACSSEDRAWSSGWMIYENSDESASAPSPEKILSYRAVNDRGVEVVESGGLSTITYGNSGRIAPVPRLAVFNVSSPAEKLETQCVVVSLIGKAEVKTSINAPALCKQYKASVTIAGLNN